MNKETYKNNQTKSYFKNYSLLFITNSVNNNSQNQRLIKQKITKLKISFYINKIYIRLTKKIFKKSLYRHHIKLINNIVYFLIPQQKIVFISLIKNLETLKFLFIGIKLNNKFYAINQIKNLKLLNYKSGITIFYQFVLINLKLIQIFTNFSKQCDLNT